MERFLRSVQLRNARVQFYKGNIVSAQAYVLFQRFVLSWTLSRCT